LVSCRENICHIVKAPANVTSDIRKRAADVAYKAVSSLEGAGVFAVELFLTGDGQVVFLLPSLRLLNVFFFSFFMILQWLPFVFLNLVSALSALTNEFMF
jgi:hypothetical protein